MNWPLLYGAIVAITVSLAWLCREHVTQKLALILLCAWASTNVAVSMFGFSAIPVVCPTIEAALAGIVAGIGYANRSPLCVVVFCLYGLMLAVHLGAYLWGWTDLHDYRAAINAIFFAQLMVVGGRSAWLVVRHWILPRNQRGGVLVLRR